MRSSRALRTAVATSGVLAAVFVLSASSCERRGTRDAPIDRDLQDNQAPFIVNMPDGYMNLALKCIGADLLVAHTRESAPVVVKDSSSCAPGEAERLGIPRVGGTAPAR